MNTYNLLFPTMAFEFKIGWKKIKEIEQKREKKKERERQIDQELLKKLAVEMALSGMATITIWSVYISFFSNYFLVK